MVTIFASRHRALVRTERELVEGSAALLGRIFRRIVRIEWGFETERWVAVANCTVRSRTGLYRASARARTLENSMHLVVHKLMKQRRRKKRRMLAQRRLPRPCPTVGLR